MISHDVCLSLSDFTQYDSLWVHSRHCKWHYFGLFLWLSDIPLDMCTTSSLSIPPLMGFSVLATVSNAAMNSFEFWFSLNIWPGMGLQDHIIALFLLFKGTSILFSIVAVPIYILTKSVGGFPFLHTLSSIYCW